MFSKQNIHVFFNWMVAHSKKPRSKCARLTLTRELEVGIDKWRKKKDVVATVLRDENVAILKWNDRAFLIQLLKREIDDARDNFTY